MMRLRVTRQGSVRPAATSPGATTPSTAREAGARQSSSEGQTTPTPGGVSRTTPPRRRSPGHPMLSSTRRRGSGVSGLLLGKKLDHL